MFANQKRKKGNFCRTMVSIQTKDTLDWCIEVFQEKQKENLFQKLNQEPLTCLIHQVIKLLEPVPCLVYHILCCFFALSSSSKPCKYINAGMTGQLDLHSLFYTSMQLTHGLLNLCLSLLFRISAAYYTSEAWNLYLFIIASMKLSVHGWMISLGMTLLAITLTLCQ